MGSHDSAVFLTPPYILSPFPKRTFVGEALRKSLTFSRYGPTQRIERRKSESKTSPATAARNSGCPSLTTIFLLSFHLSAGYTPDAIRLFRGDHRQGALTPG